MRVEGCGSEMLQIAEFLGEVGAGDTIPLGGAREPGTCIPSGSPTCVAGIFLCSVYD